MIIQQRASQIGVIHFCYGVILLMILMVTTLPNWKTKATGEIRECQTIDLQTVPRCAICFAMACAIHIFHNGVTQRLAKAQHHVPSHNYNAPTHASTVKTIHSQISSSRDLFVLQSSWLDHGHWTSMQQSLRGLLLNYLLRSKDISCKNSLI